MKNSLKVTYGLFWTQMMWTFGFLGVMFVVNVIKIILNVIKGTEVDGGFYGSIMIAANIYMLIIGITVIYFLPYYVELGVTRKDYFIGTVLASIGLSIVIPIITLLVSLLERLILMNVLNLSYKVQDLNGVLNNVMNDMDHNFGGVIAELILSVILSPNVDPSGNWILAIIVFALNIFIYYLLGWLISVGFYTGGIITGLVFIILSIGINLVKDALLRISMDVPVSDRFSALESLSLGVTLPGLLLVMIISIVIIRLLTKKATIKM